MKPNILLIVCDQLRLDCLGAAGRRPVHTPHLDRLAQSGVFCENAFTPQPICCPARQSLVSMRRPERDGLLWNYGLALPSAALAPEAGFWPAQLRRAGYRMAYVGKWHVSPEYTPVDFGYESFTDDTEYGAYREAVFGPALYANEFDGEVDPVPLEHARTHWLARTAADKLREFCAGAEPWHLRLDFPEPHLPCRPCAEFACLYDPAEIPPWEGFDDDLCGKPYIQRQQVYSWGREAWTWREWAQVVARYHAVISQVDDAVGMVLAELERCGAARNTLVVFTADHGDMCGSHHMMDKHYVLYDDVTRVPLVASWPGVLPAGIICDAFVHSTLDLGPTFLKAAGLPEPEPEQTDGRALLDVWCGRMPEDWRDCAVSTYNGQQFGLYTQRMVRTRTWKYIWNTTDVDELYHLADDPGELCNRIHDPACAPLLAQLRKKLYGILQAEGDGLVATAWMRDQLCGVTKKL